MANDDAINIDALLGGLGFTGAGTRRARRVLEDAGLTRPGKRGLAAYKREAALDAIAKALVRVCGDECAALASSDRREPVVTSGAGCEVCGGSNNRRAALACVRTLQKHRVRRMLVVGGNASQRDDVRELLSAIDVTFVDGTRSSHSQKDAAANMNRAQVLVIWGPTPLKHAVSDLYTTDPPEHLRVISVPRRGIEALCREVVRSFELSG